MKRLLLILFAVAFLPGCLIPPRHLLPHPRHHHGHHHGHPRGQASPAGR